MDMEYFVKRCLRESWDEEEIVDRLTSIIEYYKGIGVENSRKLSQAVFDEVVVTESLARTDLLTYPETGIHMGEFGVGSRGQGDFYVHSKIAEIIGNTRVDSLVNPTAQDDGGVVEVDGSRFITTAIDGIHSRLGDYPFLAGFHTARATLRDVCVMGAKPVALISDIHLADDGDIAKLLDFTSGVCAVSELTDVPLVSGSTLRVGGDMVLGDRLVGAVGAVGASVDEPTARSNIVSGDVIIMTEGSGGGTITTTDIYNNYSDVIGETLNVQFIRASVVLNSVDDIHAMTDITNGGINGDCNEINKSTGLGIHLFRERIENLINPHVLAMLNDLDIDPFGVSIDSLMIVVSEDVVDDILDVLSVNGIRADVIGFVDDSGLTVVEDEDASVSVLKPKFREAAYTPVKKVVDGFNFVDFDDAVKRIDDVSLDVIKKKDNIVRWINSRYE